MKKKLKTICIIPARGGSKGLPGKNIKIFNGKPLIAWPILAAKQCEKINEILVTTDSKEIAKQAIKRKTGARGLRSIMEDLLMDTMFGLPNNELEKVIIDEKTAVSKTQPIKLFKTKSKKTSSGN